MKKYLFVRFSLLQLPPFTCEFDCYTGVFISYLASLGQARVYMPRRASPAPRGLDARLSSAPLACWLRSYAHDRPFRWEEDRWGRYNAESGHCGVCSYEAVCVANPMSRKTHVPGKKHLALTRSVS